MIRAFAPIVTILVFVIIMAMAIAAADMFGNVASALGAEGPAEDSLFWLCSEHGNQKCGPNVTFNVALDSLLRMLVGPFFRF